MDALSYNKYIGIDCKKSSRINMSQFYYSFGFHLLYNDLLHHSSILLKHFSLYICLYKKGKVNLIKWTGSSRHILFWKFGPKCFSIITNPVALLWAKSQWVDTQIKYNFYSSERYVELSDYIVEQHSLCSYDKQADVTVSMNDSFASCIYYKLNIYQVCTTLSLSDETEELTQDDACQNFNITGRHGRHYILRYPALIEPEMLHIGYKHPHKCTCNETVEVKLFYSTRSVNQSWSHLQVVWNITNKLTQPRSFSFKSNQKNVTPQVIGIWRTLENGNSEKCVLKNECDLYVKSTHRHLKYQIYSAIGISSNKTEEYITRTELRPHEELEIYKNKQYTDKSWLDAKHLCENQSESNKTENQSESRKALPYFWDVKSEMLGILALYCLSVEESVRHPPFVVPYSLQRHKNQVSPLVYSNYHQVYTL